MNSTSAGGQRISPVPVNPLESDLVREVRLLIAGLQGARDEAAGHQPTNPQSSMFVSALSSLPDDAGEDVGASQNATSIPTPPKVVYFTSIPNATPRGSDPTVSTSNITTSTIDESAVAAQYRDALRRHIVEGRQVQRSPPRGPASQRHAAPDATQEPERRTSPSKPLRHHQPPAVARGAAQYQPSSSASPPTLTASPRIISERKRSAKKDRVAGDAPYRGESLWREKAEAQGLLIDILQRDLVHQDAALRRLEELTSRQRDEMRAAAGHHALERDEWRKQLAEVSSELSRVRLLLKSEVDAGLQGSEERARKVGGGAPCKGSQHPSYVKIYEELQQTKGHNMALRQQIIALEVQVRERDASARNAMREMQLHQQCLVASLSGNPPPSSSDGVVSQSDAIPPVVAAPRPSTDHDDGDGDLTQSVPLVLALLRRLSTAKRNDLLVALQGDLKQPTPRRHKSAATTPKPHRRGSTSATRRPPSASRRPSPFRNCIL